MPTKPELLLLETEEEDVEDDDDEFNADAELGSSNDNSLDGNLKPASVRPGFMPPHLFMQQHTNNAAHTFGGHMISSSVTEGAGCTLKGARLSTVRNAVLRQTGFLT